MNTPTTLPALRSLRALPEEALRFQITRAALYVPPHVETAEALAPRIGRSADWILKRTGVAQRRVSEQSMAEMGAEASRRALNGEVPDLIINASLTPHSAHS